MPRTADAKRLLAQANKLLASRDLASSRRLALRALDADPLLDGADQALAVSDVLLAAGRAVDGRTDWYAVLRIDPPHAAVDPATIKRKYRKLALLLHPDKNNSPGADAAFKLVLDAWSVLSDPTRRAAFDRDLAIAAAPLPDNFFAGCPYCNHIHEYPRVYEDRILRCSKCRCGFRAEEVRIAPQLVPGMDAYYFNWGFCYPPAMPVAIAGCAAFGGLGPTPFLGMPNMANPYFPSPMSYASPAPAPATGVKPGGDKDGGRSGAAAEHVDGGSKAAAAARKGASANSETKQGRSRSQPRVKALTSSAPARQSPRLRAGLAGNAAPVVEPVKDVDPVETGTAKKAVVETRKKAEVKTAKKAAVKNAPVETAKKAEVKTATKTAAKKASVETARKAPAADRAEKKLPPARTLRSSGTVELTMPVEEKGARKKKAPPAAVAPEALPAKRQKRGGDVMVDEGKVGVEKVKEEVRQEDGTLFEGFGNGGLDTDISDILNSLPKIYDASGEEVRF